MMRRSTWYVGNQNLIKGIDMSLEGISDRILRENRQVIFGNYSREWDFQIESEGTGEDSIITIRLGDACHLENCLILS